MTEWYKKFYADVDNMRMEGFLAGQTEDAIVVVGNFPKAVGKEQIRGGIGAFWDQIGGLKHNFVNVIESGNTTVLEAMIDYTRKDGAVVTVPCASVLKRRGDLVCELRVYLDVTPVFAPR